MKKEGYQTQTVTVDSKLGGGGAVAGAGNIILGGVIGGIVDGTERLDEQPDAESAEDNFGPGRGRGDSVQRRR